MLRDDFSRGEIEHLLQIGLNFVPPSYSGLDSSSSFHCIKVLKTLARGGRTVVCSIHQPSATLFAKFDHLYALAEGHCIYRGATPELLGFLSLLGHECPAYHNPADFSEYAFQQCNQEIIRGNYQITCSSLPFCVMPTVCTMYERSPSQGFRIFLINFIDLNRQMILV